MIGVSSFSVMRCYTSTSKEKILSKVQKEICIVIVAQRDEQKMIAEEKKINNFTLMRPFGFSGGIHEILSVFSSSTSTNTSVGALVGPKIPVP